MIVRPLNGNSSVPSPFMTAGHRSCGGASVSASRAHAAAAPSTPSRTPRAIELVNDDAVLARIVRHGALVEADETLAGLFAAEATPLVVDLGAGGFERLARVHELLGQRRDLVGLRTLREQRLLLGFQVGD